MRMLIAEMLNKDPKKRPSVKRILEKDFLAERIANLIPMSIVKQELGNTFVNNHVVKQDKDSVKTARKDGVDSSDGSRDGRDARDG